MRRTVLVACVAMIGCGGSGGGGGKIDPAAMDACLAWANGVCRLAFLCVDASAQDATFKARYGTSQDTCFTNLMARCQSNQTGSGAFGPSCGPGKVVNQTALQTCEDNLQTLLCTDWMTMQDGSCTGICGASTTGTGGMGGGGGGGGTTGGGGTGGTGAGGSGGHGTGTYIDFCFTYGYAVCDRQVACDPTTTLDYCRSLIDALCPYASCSTTYNQQQANACIPAVQAATCDQVLNGSPPAACGMACPM